MPRRRPAFVLAAAALALPAAAIASPSVDDDVAQPPGVAGEAPATADPGAASPPATTSDTGVADSPGSGDPATQIFDAETPPDPVRVAYAEPPSMTAPVPVIVAPPAPAPTGADAHVAGDAAAGRAYLSPTAFTSPKGTATVSAWFPGLPVAGMFSLGYALTDRIEIAAGGMGAFEEDDGLLYLSGKAQLLRGATGGIAVQVQHVAEDGDDSLTFWSVVGSKCFDPACRTVGSLHLTAMPGEEYYYDGYEDGTRSTLSILAGGSIVTGGKIKVVIDAFQYGDEYDDLFVAYGGLRYASPKLSADFGLVVGWEDGDAEVLPVPLASVSARW